MKSETVKVERNGGRTVDLRKVLQGENGRSQIAAAEQTRQTFVASRNDSGKSK